MGLGHRLDLRISELFPRLSDCELGFQEQLSSPSAPGDHFSPLTTNGCRGLRSGGDCRHLMWAGCLPGGCFEALSQITTKSTASDMVQGRDHSTTLLSLALKLTLSESHQRWRSHRGPLVLREGTPKAVSDVDTLRGQGANYWGAQGSWSREELNPSQGLRELWVCSPLQQIHVSLALETPELNTTLQVTTLRVT